MGYGPYSSDVTLLLSVARNMKEGMLIHVSDKNVCFEKLGLGLELFIFSGYPLL